MSDSVWPHRWQPTRLLHPWESQGKNTGVGCHFLLQCMKVKRKSEVAQSCPTLSEPMDCSLPVSSIHGFSRHEYWSGVPLPSSIFGYKEYNQSDFSVDHLVMSMYKVFSCVVGRGCLLRPVRSLGNSLLAFDLLHFFTARLNLTVLPGISWLPTFSFQSPIMKRTSFLGVNYRRSCRSS